MKKASLQNKITTTMAVVILLLGLGLTFSLKAVLAPSLRKELIKKGTAITRLLAERVAKSFLERDGEQLRKLLQEGKTISSDISYIMVTDTKGDVSAHTFSGMPPGFLQNRTTLTGVQLLDTEKGLIYEIAASIPGTRGIIRVGIGPGLIRRRLANIAGLIIGITILAILLSTLISYGLSKVIIKPIKKLQTGVKKIGEGELDYKIAIHTGDEIEKLADEFNRMAEKLKDSYSGLEEKVRKATEGLAEEKHRLESVIQSMGEGLFITDRKGEIISWNVSAEKITGYPAKEVLGRKCKEIFRITSEDGRDLCLSQCPMKEAFQKKEIVLFPLNPTPYITRKDGQRVPVSVISAPILDNKNNVGGGVETFRDITREKEIDRMRSEFVSLVSHELRTPLTAIKGFTDTLLRKDIKIAATTGQEYLRIIQRQSNRLTRLIGDFLDVSKIESGKMEMRWEKVCIPELITELTNNFRTKTTKHTFSIFVTKDFPVIIADRDKVEQILVNLIDNAIKYSPHGGEIRITGENGNEFIKCSVSDQGVGIKKEDIDRLFEKFQRINPEISRQTPGTGLGLAICQGLVKLHNGEIHVQSQYGRGTTFTFTLAKEPGGKKQPHG